MGNRTPLSSEAESAVIHTMEEVTNALSKAAPLSCALLNDVSIPVGYRKDAEVLLHAIQRLADVR